MSRNEKLRTLIRLLSHREEQARRDLVRRQRDVEGASAKADELAGLRQEYGARLEAAAGAGLSARDLQLWRQFNRSLDEVVDVQSAQVERLRQELEQAQSVCLAALVKRRGGEQLQETQRQRDADRARRRERVDASDQAARLRRP